MKQYHVAILGATGAVGREMQKLLAERRFPLATLRLLASERSAGTTIEWNGERLPVEAAGRDAFRGMDFVLGAADSAVAKKYAGAIAEAGAIFIDNSSAFRGDSNVPLVIPEVNPADALRHRGLLSNPNCSTIITVTAIHALHALSPIRAIVASTYQAVSGAGAGGIAELMAQTAALAAGEQAQSRVFPHPIAYNLIPQIGAAQEAGYTSEEMKMQQEARRLLHQPELRVTCTCVRVPVLRCHSISVLLRFARPVSVAEARASLAGAAGCRLCDDLQAGQYPMPLTATNQDLVYVGRIRADLTDACGLTLWCCGDQLRKGAATNAIQIAELLTAQ